MAVDHLAYGGQTKHSHTAELATKTTSYREACDNFLTIICGMPR